MQAQAPAEAAAPPVALAAQVQPLQVPFNGGVGANFIVTGAQLIGQQVQVARTLVNDISNGTPVPVAVGRAVAGFIQIEVVAGHDLVAFGRQVVDFQSQSRQTVRTQATSRPDNIVTLRRDNSRSTAVQGDSKPSSRVTHRLRDVIAGSEHQQRHRRDRQQDNAGDDNARHRKPDN